MIPIRSVKVIKHIRHIRHVKADYVQKLLDSAPSEQKRAEVIERLAGYGTINESEILRAVCYFSILHHLPLKAENILRRANIPALKPYVDRMNQLTRTEIDSIFSKYDSQIETAKKHLEHMSLFDTLFHPMEGPEAYFQRKGRSCPTCAGIHKSLAREDYEVPDNLVLKL